MCSYLLICLDICSYVLILFLIFVDMFQYNICSYVFMFIDMYSYLLMCVRVCIHICLYLNDIY